MPKSSLCLFHVNSGILLQLWKGVIQNYVSDGTPMFPVTCSDGFFQIMNQYPERQLSSQCWKTFDDGVNCPYAAHGSAGPGHLRYYLESANGCRRTAWPATSAGTRPPAGRRHQRRLHRVPGLWPQHGHRNVDHFRTRFGAWRCGDLVQRAATRCSLPGHSVDGELPGRVRDTPTRSASSAPGLWAGSAVDVVQNADGYRTWWPHG